MIGHDKLWSYINKNQNDLEKLGISFEVVEISSGDRYYYEMGSSIIITTLDNKYCVGYCNITEDDDDWAQAESYVVDWCRCDGKDIECEHLYNILLNYKSIIRDNKLNQLI